MRDRVRKRSRERLRRATLPGGLVAKPPKVRFTTHTLKYNRAGWLAVEGLSSYEMHDISPFSDEDRERILKAMERLLSNGIANQPPST